MDRNQESGRDRRLQKLEKMGDMGRGWKRLEEMKRHWDTWGKIGL